MRSCRAFNITIPKNWALQFHYVLHFALDLKLESENHYF